MSSDTEPHAIQFQTPNAPLPKSTGVKIPNELPLPTRLPSLDGWRAFSIAMVLAAHCQHVHGFPPSLTPIFNKVFYPEFGVRCFFVISGFLITWLMITEANRHGKVNLRQFYIRRALRIFPVYFLFVLCLATIHWLGTFDQNSAAWIGNLTFTTNFVHPTWPSGHLWSLAVEEQFYLIWPLLLTLFGLWKKPKSALVALALPMVIAPICRVITYKQFYPASLSTLFAHFSFFNFFDSLAIGCACAILFGTFRGQVQTNLRAHPKLVSLLGLGLVLIPYLLRLLHLPGSFYVATDHTFQGLGFALLMVQSLVLPTSGLYQALNWKWSCHIGVLSFSIYIWQQIFCTDPTVFGTTPHWWLSFPLWFIPVLLVAHLSYYSVERPFLQMRSKFR